MLEEKAHKGDALQDAWPDATCYGCGPANNKGLRIKSYWSEDGSEVVCIFEPKAEYNAGFPNVMYGGLVASLIDCHSIWTAIAHTYREEERPHGSLPAISYVTGSLTVRYLKPTSLNKPVTLRARVTELHPKKAIIECDFYSGGIKSAEGLVTAVRFNMDKSLGAEVGSVEPHAKTE